MATFSETRNQRHPKELLEERASAFGCSVTDPRFASEMDLQDPLKEFRDMFFYPKMKDLPTTDLSLVDPEKDCVYFCGNSLGLEPKGVRHHIDVQLDKWAKYGVYGHERGVLPWAHGDECVDQQMSSLVGGEEDEVTVMNGLSINLHLMMISFYRPTKQRHKILFEGHAFPSDHYVFESQVKLHGFDPATSLVCLNAREGETNLRLEDILSTIESVGDEIAVICFSGVQYYTGQLFDIPTITSAGRAKGCYVGWDLAHAVGNVELKLHEWNVDFACWCTYKYLNSGAGSLAGVFLNNKYKHNDFPKLLGWWGHKHSTRFQMTNVMDISPGVYGYRVSNPEMLTCSAILASMDIFTKTNMTEIRRKSLLLTAYLELLLKHHFPKPEDETTSSKSYIEIITPADPEQRGAQLSVMFSIPITKVHAELDKRGVVLDKREPNVLRVAPAPLYNSFTDVFRFIALLESAIATAAKL